MEVIQATVFIQWITESAVFRFSVTRTLVTDFHFPARRILLATSNYALFWLLNEFSVFIHISRASLTCG